MENNSPTDFALTSNNNIHQASHHVAMEIMYVFSPTVSLSEPAQHQTISQHAWNYSNPFRTTCPPPFSGNSLDHTKTSWLTPPVLNDEDRRLRRKIPPSEHWAEFVTLLWHTRELI